MQGTEDPTFRPTVWPAEPPDIPPVTRYGLEHDGGSTCRVHDVNRDAERAVLPPDFAIRELLDVPDDAAGLVHFMRAWGLLVDLPREGLVVDMGEARWRLWELQSMARHLIAYRDGDDEALVEAWFPLERPAQVSQAWTRFQDTMNRALRPFGVHVRLGPDDSAALSRPVPNLYNATALQLAQYLSSDEPIVRCGNERCRRPFTVQRSERRRYTSSHHVAGVRYCSHNCAKAQSERDRRARRRQEKGTTS